MNNSMSWLRGCGVYLLHTVIGGVVVFLVGMVLGAGVEALNQKVGDLLFWGPIFPAEIAVRRADELDSDVAAAIEAATDGLSS